MPEPAPSTPVTIRYEADEACTLLFVRWCLKRLPEFQPALRTAYGKLFWRNPIVWLTLGMILLLFLDFTYWHSLRESGQTILGVVLLGMLLGQYLAVPRSLAYAILDQKFKPLIGEKVLTLGETVRADSRGEILEARREQVGVIFYKSIVILELAGRFLPMPRGVYRDSLQPWMARTA